MYLRRKLFVFGVCSLILAGVGLFMIRRAERSIMGHVWAK